MSRPTPTIKRWQLGQQLRALREGANVSLRDAAAEIEVSTSTLSRIEGGKQTIKPIYVRLLAVLYAADAATTEALRGLAEDAQQPEWYASLAKNLPNWFQLYLGYESAASVIRTYGSELVDGRLQTSAYVRAIALASRPDATSAMLDSAVALRQRRRERIVGSDPPILHSVINEAVLRRMVGDRETMREQLHHIAELAELPHVTVQVLAYDAGAHPAMTAPFTMLGFAEPYELMNTVYLENGRGALYLEGQADLERYTWMFDQIAGRSLPPERTRDLLVKVAHDL